MCYYFQLSEEGGSSHGMRGVPRPQIPVLMDDELSSDSDSDVEPDTQTSECWSTESNVYTCSLHHIV